MKDSKKGRVSSCYKPIAWLSIMWKLLTGIIEDKIYSHLERSSFLQNKYKGCHGRYTATKYQLLVDKTILRN